MKNYACLSMGLIQKIVKALLPAATVASMEAESRAWKVRCDTCGSEQSIWDMGGIRWAASGSKTTPAKCEKCGAWKAHTIYHSPPPSSDLQ